MGEMTDSSSINLEHLAYDHANFAHSQKEPTTVSSRIKGKKSYYYHWASNGKSLDILTFENPFDLDTAKIFRYSLEQLSEGVNLSKDKPKFIGIKAVKILKDYVKSEYVKVMGEN